MKILVVASHPDMENSVVNKQWMKELKRDTEITVRLLDELYPNGKIDLEAEKKVLEQHDRIVYQYPFYWYNMPALLREYFDKVLEYGWAYGPGGDALEGKEMLVALSIGAAENTYQGGGYNNFTVTELLRPVEATANAVKMVYLPPFLLFDTPRLSEEEIKDSAARYISHIKNEDINHRVFLKKIKEKTGSSSFTDL